VRFILFLVNLFPYRLAVKAGSFMGRLIYYIPVLKKTVYKGLNTAFTSEKSQGEIKRIAKESFKHFGRLCFEAMKLMKFTKDDLSKLIKLNNNEEFIEDFNRGKGMILICSHLANWEILGAGWSNFGIKADAIVRPLDNILLDKHVENMRKRFGMGVIPRKEVIKKGFRAIKEGKGIVFLMDQNTVKNPVFVPFFNYDAATVSGPAIFSYKFDCPVGLSWDVRNNDNTHSLYYKRLEIKRDIKDRDEFIKYHTAYFTNEIEKIIRENPEQWLWLHERWKTRP
jgi:KDO2-lipid IV(A) lauroyltransferase